MKRKIQTKLKVNADAHAKNMIKALGVHRARNVITSLLKGLSEQNYTKVHNADEIASLKGFWTNALGVVNKLGK
jgi:hypothetical protein